METQEVVPTVDNQIVQQDKTFIHFQNGLVVQPDCTFKEWERKGEALNTVAEVYTNYLPWWIGDWILAGERLFGRNERYQQALKASHYVIGTLYNATSTCRRIPINERNKNLSFSHHKCVAKYDAETRAKWLADAEINHWNHKQLEAAMKGRPIPKEIPDRIQLIEKEEREAVKTISFDEWWKENEVTLRLDPMRTSCKRAWFAALEAK